MQDGFRLFGQRTIATGELRVQLGVAMDPVLTVPRLLHFSCLAYPRADHSGGLPRCAAVDLLHRYRVHLDLNIDSVQQRAGDPVQIAADFVL